jgi:hypothetical protein
MVQRIIYKRIHVQDEGLKSNEKEEEENEIRGGCEVASRCLVCTCSFLS